MASMIALARPAGTKLGPSLAPPWIAL